MREAAFRAAAPGDEGGAKAWRDIWSAGHGVGSIDDLPTVAALVTRLVSRLSAG